MRREWFLLAAGLIMASGAGADEPIERYQVVSPKGDGIEVTAMNGRGEVVGFEWADDEVHLGVVEQKPFFARGRKMTRLPLLEGYTATLPAAVSDDGLVVGRASKPAPPGVRVPLRNQAFLWDAKGGIRGLGVVEEDRTSFASGISRDGRCISGSSVGDDRVRACVWERDGDGWKANVLPHASGLGSHTVAISGDGRYVAGVDGAAPCLWTRGASGEWSREEIGDAGSLIPRAVNDSAVVVGGQSTGDGLTHAVIWSREAGRRRLEKPEGFQRSEALAVNNAGTVVGMVDGPASSRLGPNAFVFENGRLRLLDEGGSSFASATAINDQGQVAGVMEEREP